MTLSSHYKQGNKTNRKSSSPSWKRSARLAGINTSPSSFGVLLISYADSLPTACHSCSIKILMIAQGMR